MPVRSVRVRLVLLCINLTQYHGPWQMLTVLCLEIPASSTCTTACTEVHVPIAEPSTSVSSSQQGTLTASPVINRHSVTANSHDASATDSPQADGSMPEDSGVSHASDSSVVQHVARLLEC